MESNKSNNINDLPKDIFFLGYSGAMLSILFDRLKICGFKGQIIIIKNQGQSDEVPYENGLNYLVKSIDDPSVQKLTNCIVAVSSPKVKRQIYNDFYRKMKLTPIDFISLIDPRAVISSNAILGRGISIEPNVTVAPYGILGFSTTIARNASLGHHSIMGSYSSLNPGVQVAGHCIIGEGTTIGIGAVVFDHIKIGDNCLIGGGSVVTKDIPDNVIAFGNPCRIVKERI